MAVLIVHDGSNVQMFGKNFAKDLSDTSAIGGGDKLPSSQAFIVLSRETQCNVVNIFIGALSIHVNARTAPSSH